MAHLRLSSGFADHPKLEELDDRTFRCWVKLLCRVAAYRLAGRVGPGDLRAVGVTRRMRERLLELRLLDDADGDGWRVHDWESTNGSIDRIRERDREAQRARRRERRAMLDALVERELRGGDT